MTKKIFVGLLILFFLSFFSYKTNAQSSTNLPSPKQEFYKAVVVEIAEQGETEIENYKSYYQVLKVKISEGPEKGNLKTIENGKQFRINKNQLLIQGQEIIVAKVTYPNNQTIYSVYDFYRLNMLAIFLIIFFIAVLLVGGKKGLGSTLGMLISLFVILTFIVPFILKGYDPLTITIIGSMIIILTTTYLAHGVSQKTTIALISTVVSLIFTAGFALLAIQLSSITGLGNEEAYSLQLGPTSIIDIRGLFLSGIIITTLGALNDITTTQSATVYELRQANQKLTFIQLFEKGLSVGKEHIASLVNTLILAYVGSAFAVFIFLVLNPGHLPYWVILNNEIISDEIIKIISGSMGLLLSVPIVTLIAAYWFGGREIKEIKKQSQNH
ncbi:MAG: YibE/F family protein [Candidatus Levybacteria bacterium]|nr:YibE/F family protein [Candidatus Levybacteria bacterium]